MFNQIIISALLCFCIAYAYGYICFNFLFQIVQHRDVLLFLFPQVVCVDQLLLNAYNLSNDLDLNLDAPNLYLFTTGASIELVIVENLIIETEEIKMFINLFEMF